MAELKPCPFCGSKNVSYTPIEEQSYEGHTEGFIWCHGCGFSSDVFLDLEFAVNMWNRRADNG